MTHNLNKTFNGKFIAPINTYENVLNEYNSNKDYKKKIIDLHEISSFRNDECICCEGNSDFEFRPTSATFYIYLSSSHHIPPPSDWKNPNNWEIYAFIKKGSWGFNNGDCYGCKEYESDCDIESDDAIRRHKTNQGPKIFSIKKKNLDELKDFLNVHKLHISSTFKKFLEEKFLIKF
jgi:hypothetical protein